MSPESQLKYAVAYLISTNPGISATELHEQLAEIGINVGSLTAAAMRREYIQTVREIEKLQNPEQPEPKKKRYRVRTWYPDG
jgi:hypothetical protein